MKRFVCLLIILCLPLTALADTVAERVGAPEEVRMTFASPSGKTVVSMDAAVEMPDVDAVPVMEVVQTMIPADRVVALANLLIGEGQWSGETDYGPQKPMEHVGLAGPVFEGLTEASMDIEGAEASIYGWPAKSLTAYSSYQHGEIRGFEGLNYSAWRQGMSFGYNWEPVHALRGQEARGCRYTREEAAAIARQVQQTLAPELTEMVCGVISNEKEDIVQGHPENIEDAYIFYFTRNAMGIPVTYSIQAGTKVDSDANDNLILYRQVIYYENLRVLITDSGVSVVRYETPMELLPPEAADCELLPFESVIHVTETILPLKYTHLEGSYDEVRVSIDRVAFGYMRLYDAGEMYRWHLVPVWDFFGTYELVRDGKVIVSHSEDLSSLFTVNAMNGIVIDREYGY